jgi:uncharacterized membrane protein YhhN
MPWAHPDTVLWPDERWIFLVGGAVLFFVSDVAVARDRFVEPSWKNRAWGLPAYYAGQLLLAWGALFARGLP